MGWGTTLPHLIDRLPGQSELCTQWLCWQRLVRWYIAVIELHDDSMSCQMQSLPVVASRRYRILEVRPESVAYHKW